jgi:glycosyltransferase involved in cell wall biosynthesis
VRVLVWAETFWPAIGGVEILAAKLLPELAARGHQLIVVTPEGPDRVVGRAQHGDIPVHRLPLWAAVQARNLERLMWARQQVAQLRRAFKPELVHVYVVGPSLFFQRQTAHAHPAPVLVSLHQANEDRALRPDTSLGATLRSADWIAACSAAVLRETRRQLPEVTPRSSAILNALEMPGVSPAPLPFDPPRLLCLGRLVRPKGFDLALEAFARLVDRFPAARLVVAGDGDARPELERQGVELRLAGRVDFPGWVDPADVPDLINASTMIIMPSRCDESFGLVALQAAQMARPVVATRVGGLPEVVVHPETGLLVDKEDPRALAEAIASLLSDPPAAGRMGEATRRRAQEVFSWEGHVDAYDALYRRLAAAGRRAGARSH